MVRPLGIRLGLALLLAGRASAAPPQLGEVLDLAMVWYRDPASVPKALVERIGNRFQRREDEVRALLGDAGRRQRADQERARREAAKPDPYLRFDMGVDPRSGLIPLGQNPQGQDEYWHPISDGVMVLVPEGLTRAAPSMHPNRTDVGSRRTGPFLLDEVEVSVRRYDRFLRETGHPAPESWTWQWGMPDRPAVDLAWEDAAAFADWAGARLPTEAEWERATFGPGNRWFPWGNRRPAAADLPHLPARDRVGPGRLHRLSVADAAGHPRSRRLGHGMPLRSGPGGRDDPDGFSRHGPVSFREWSEVPVAPASVELDRSVWGIRDLAWNVREWMEDRVDGTRPGARSHQKLAKGGSYADDPREVRHLWGRHFLWRRRRYADVGFRLAIPLRPGRVPLP